MIKVFIDGKEGTTGLQLFDRLKERKNIELISLPEHARKDERARREALNECDFAFLCLPDAAAVQAAEMIVNPNVRVVDASTAHRTAEGWAYGFPELSKAHCAAVKNGGRTAVPGCHASGFAAIVYPLVKCGIVKSDYPFACTSVTGYSGGGKKMIAQYGDESLLHSVRQYALSQSHKHLKEMQFVSGLAYAPLFQPYVAPFYCGMEVSVPLYTRLFNTKHTPESLTKFYADYYSAEEVVSVENPGGDFISAEAMGGTDGMRLIVCGNDERITLTALYDNLGKGASGAAVECFNIMTGEDKTYGLKRLFG
jgi:N-acetyl-gamma-glutamyl-phosphate reductase